MASQTTDDQFTSGRARSQKSLDVPLTPTLACQSIWRITQDSVLRPVEIIPGTWRYPFREIIALARQGVDATTEAAAHRDKSAA